MISPMGSWRLMAEWKEMRVCELLRPRGWEETWRETHETDERHAYRYAFVNYCRSVAP